MNDVDFLILLLLLLFAFYNPHSLATNYCRLQITSYKIVPCRVTKGNAIIKMFDYSKR